MGSIHRWGLPVVLGMALCACGSDRNRGPDGGGGGGTDAGGPFDAAGGSDAGGGTDAGGMADAGSPPAGSLVFDASDIFEGSLWLAGTVTMPETSTGSPIQINVVGTPDEGFPGNQLGLLGSTAGETVDYAVTGLAPGVYQVQIRVDATGDGMLGMTGDWEGWYDGTVAAPITDQGSAADVEVRTGPVTGVDFGIAVVP